ncbi:DNA helicase/exodeoxyribonuclease V, gamma subunit [Chitinophaga sp. CF118]|uniref:exodeoxyribonuclease V subunit gamma n=1 Tax=Chitinophaga sp. CF118 TaxID=1884367 RepID=UPI0008ED6E17|nr:exodeoxyribonuclease V subunit gamma [Chitinophaga sp. CF118]SFE07647.1 DNA helicase/exodeoxyribonuclease V, gamma subunit [Chitinophaga sp. CF118]
MALYLKVSNSLESLSQGLSLGLHEAQNSVFEPHLIVTQTEGMNNWLKLQIASHLGIAANCRFLKPNDLIHQLYYLLGGRYTEILSAQNLTWLLFKLLGESDFTNKYPTVAAYYLNSGTDQDLKRMGLAKKAADLFDQYQIYRPEMIREWNGKSLKEVGEDDWQEYLWIKARIVSDNSLPDKTIIGQHILEALRNPDEREALSNRMRAIHLFGLSIITAYHVKILYDLSEYIDVYFHIINPSPAVYWFDDRSEKQLARWRHKGKKDVDTENAGNPLVSGWGRVVQDTFGLFFKHDEFVNAYDDSELVPPEPDSLLHKIQDDIFNSATTNRNRLSPADLNDGSITMNACYTVAREVEVLYNYLVYLVDKKKEHLSPRDIVVMVSDIDAYAPYIKAVFNNAPYKFRYTIADESYADSDNLFNALHAILHMNEDNFKAEEVLQLLDFSYIRKRFAINDVPLIRQVVDAANIRFGMEGAKEDETYLVSWKYGIKRIMYGICMSGGEEYGEGADSFFPLDILEGSAGQEVIRFCHFVEILMQVIQEQKQDRSITSWVAYIESVLHNMVYEPEEDTDEDYNTLMQQLSDYNLLNEYMSDTVGFDVFGHSFLETLTATTRSGLFVNGGITFCSLIPMRSIPFKVVAMLGLNYDKFPRREHSSGFNLMERDKQRGDRNVKENDKHLFLETLLSAREYLYISYVGQSAKDNTGIPPSALVDELIDYIESGMEEPEGVRKKLVTLHPLQGFSAKYSTKGSLLYNYLNTAVTEKKAVTNKDKVIEPFGFEEIMLEDLVRFFRNPIRTYYNKVLGIYYNDTPVLLRDKEMFDLNNLQEWSLKSRLLPLNAVQMKELKKKLVKTGKLPLKNMADVSLKLVEEMIDPIRGLYEITTSGAEEQIVPVELTIDKSVIKGVLHGVFNNKLVELSWSQAESKYLVDAYIRYLAGTAAGVLKGLFFISAGKKENVFEAVELKQEEAMERLTRIVKIYKAGMEKIAPFYPDLEIVPEKIAELDFEKFTKTVADKLAVKSDPYIILEYRNGFFSDESVLDAYKAICEEVLIPLEELLPGYYA